MPFQPSHHESWYHHPDFLFAHPIRAMYIGDTLRGFGAGLFGIFAPVYLFNVLRDSLVPMPLAWVFVYYGAYWLFAAMWMYFATRMYPKIGFKGAMIVGFVAITASIVFLALAESQGAWMLVLSVIGGSIYSGFFWPAYHIVYSRVASDGHRAQAVGTRSALIRIAQMISPIIGAFIIVQFGFAYVLGALLFMYLMAFIPYSTVEMNDGHRGGIKPIIREIYQPGGKAAVLAFWGSGIALPLASYAWPILLFLIGISYEELGLLATAASVVTIATLYIFGKFSDNHDKSVVLRRSSIAYAGAWVMRIASGGLWSAFMADAFANMSGGVAAIPLGAYTYDRLAKEKPNEQVHLILLRELSINFGKVSGALLVIVLLIIGVEIRWILAVGIPAALLMPLLAKWGNAKSETRHGLVKGDSEAIES